MTTALPSIDAFRHAGWLPDSSHVHKKWLNDLRREVASKIQELEVYHHATRSSARADQNPVIIPRPELLPAVQEFKDFIEGDPNVYTEFIRMFEGVKNEPKDYYTLIAMYNRAIRIAPTPVTGPPMSMVMLEIMNTQAGFSAFTKDSLNEHYKKMMQTWTTFLKSPNSRYVLSDVPVDGWLSPEVKESLVLHYPGRSFEEVFVCDESAPHYGFTSFDDFFTRRYRNVQGDRLIDETENLQLVSAPCESSVFAIRHNVQAIDKLFIKGEAYSLHHLLCGDESVPSFIEGTIFQTFLSTTDYHHWHAPVNGTIQRIIPVPGTYFTQAPNTLDDPFPWGSADGKVPPPYLRSLTYFANTAARLIMFIEADNKSVGLMCFIAIGMGEISSCEATVYEGQKVKRGDQLGMFHFGGSTCLLLFNKHAQLEIDNKYWITKDKPDIHVRINEKIGTVAAPPKHIIS